MALPTPQLYWQFAEGSGTTAADGSGNGWTGTLNGSTSWVAGKFDNGVQMDASSAEYVQAPTSPSQFSAKGWTAITIAAWIKTSDTAHFGVTGDRMNIAGAMGTSSQNSEFCLNVESTNLNLVYCDSAGTTHSLQKGFSGTFNDGAWHHIVGTYDSATGVMNVYVDGSSLGNSTGNTGTIGKAVATQGFRASSVNWHDAFGWPGAVDEVRVYNTALSSADVSTLFGLLPKAVSDSNAANWGNAFGSAKATVLTQTCVDAFAQATAPPTANLQLLFGFSEQELGAAPATIADQSTNAFTGTVHGALDLSQGHEGAALHNLTTGWLSVPHNATHLDGLAAISVACWVKPDAGQNWSAAGTNLFVSKGTASEGANAPTNEWTLGLFNNDQIQVGVTTSSTQTMGPRFTTPGPLFDDGSWHHIGFSYSAGTLKIYCDGVLATTDTTHFSGAIQATLSPVTILGATASSGGFTSAADALADDVRVYSAVLADSDFAALASNRDGGIVWTATAPLTLTASDNGSANWSDATIRAIGFASSQADNGGTNWAEAFGSAIGKVLIVADGAGSTALNGQLIFYNLDEGSGTAVGNSAAGGGYPATLTTGGGTVTWGTGIRGGDLVFASNASGWASTPSAAAIAGMSALSVSIWFKASSFSGAADLCAKGDSAEEWSFVANGNNQLVVNLVNSAGTTKIFSSSTVTPYDNNAWHNAVFTYDGTTVNIYLDGVNIKTDSTTISGALHSTTELVVLGGGSVSGSGFNGFRPGALDEFRLWNRALTSGEVGDVFNDNLAAGGDAVANTLSDMVGLADSDASNWGDASQDLIVYLLPLSDTGAANWSDAFTSALVGLLSAAFADSASANWGDALNPVLGQITSASDGAGANWSDATAFNLSFQLGVVDDASGSWADAFGFVLVEQLAVTDNASANWGDTSQGLFNGIAVADGSSPPWADSLGLGLGFAYQDAAGGPWSDQVGLGVGATLADSASANWADSLGSLVAYRLAVSDSNTANGGDAVASDSSKGFLSIADSGSSTWAEVLAIGYAMAVHDRATMADVGMTLYWPFIEGSGTTAHDWTGLGGDGTFQGALTWIGSGVNDAAIYAPVTDGSEYIQAGASFTASGYAALSVVVWVQSTFAFTGGKKYGLVGKRGATDNLSEFALGLDGNNGLYFGVNSGAWTESAQVGGASLNDNRWHMLAGVYDGSHLRVYADGVQIGSDVSLSGAISLKSANPLKTPYLADFSFDGLVDQVRIYSRGLSIDEIQAMFTAPDLSGAEDIATDLLVTSFVPLGKSLSDLMLVPSDAALQLYEPCDPGTLPALDAHTSYAAGAFGGAIRFDSTHSGEVSISSNTGYSGMSALTLSVWFKTTGKSTDGDNTLLAKGYGKDSSFAALSEFWLGFNNNNTVQLVLTDASHAMHTFTAAVSPVFDDNAWHNLIATYDGTTVVLYFDGTALFSDSTSMSGAVNSTTQAVTLGNSVKTRGYSGDLDEMRVYSRALNVQEVQGIFNLIGAGEGFAAFASYQVPFAISNAANWNDAESFIFGYGPALADDGSANWTEALAANRIFNQTQICADSNSANWSDALTSNLFIALVVVDLETSNWADAFQRIEGEIGPVLSDDGSANWADQFVRGQFQTCADDASGSWADAFAGVLPVVSQTAADAGGTNWADAFIGALEPAAIPADNLNNWSDAVASAIAVMIFAGVLSDDLSQNWNDAAQGHQAAGVGVAIFEPPVLAMQEAFAWAPGTELNFGETLAMLDLLAWFSGNQLSLADVDDHLYDLRDQAAVLMPMFVSFSDANALSDAIVIYAQGGISQTCADDASANWSDAVFYQTGNFIAFSAGVVDAGAEFAWADAWLSCFGQPVSLSDSASTNWFELAALELDYKLQFGEDESPNYIDGIVIAWGLLAAIGDDGSGNWAEEVDFNYQRTLPLADDGEVSWVDRLDTFGQTFFALSDSGLQFDAIAPSLGLGSAYADQGTTNWGDATAFRQVTGFGVVDDASGTMAEQLDFLFPIGRAAADQWNAWSEFEFHQGDCRLAVVDDASGNWTGEAVEFVVELLRPVDAGTEFAWADALSLWQQRHQHERRLRCGFGIRPAEHSAKRGASGQ